MWASPTSGPYRFASNTNASAAALVEHWPVKCSKTIARGMATADNPRASASKRMMAVLQSHLPPEQFGPATSHPACLYTHSTCCNRLFHLCLGPKLARSLTALPTLLALPLKVSCCMGEAVSNRFSN